MMVVTLRVNLYRFKYPHSRGSQRDHPEGQSEREVQLKKLYAPTFIDRSLTQVKMSPDGQTMAVGDSQGHVYVIGAVLEQQGAGSRWDVVADWQVGFSFYKCSKFL